MGNLREMSSYEAAHQVTMFNLNTDLSITDFEPAQLRRSDLQSRMPVGEFDTKSAQDRLIPEILAILGRAERYDNGEPVAKAERIFTMDRELISPNGLLLVAVKGYDLETLDKLAANSVHGQGIIDRAVGQRDRIARGAFGAIPLTAVNQTVTQRDMIKFPLLDNFDLVAPRDWKRIGNRIFIASDMSIIRYDLESGEVAEARSFWLAMPHSISPNHDNTRILVTATGIDGLLEMDIESGNCVRFWSAWDHGFNFSMGVSQDGQPLKLIHSFQDHDLSDIEHLQRFGYQIARYHRSEPAYDMSELVSARQTCHFNSAIYHPQKPELIITTAMATADVDIKTGERKQRKGTGGKVLAIHADDRAEILVDGLANPHHIVYLGNYSGVNYYMLANTGIGRLNFYKESLDNILHWDKVGEMSFENMPERSYRSRQWLQSVYPALANDGSVIFTAVDSGRRAIFVFDILKRTYSFRTSDYQTVVHKAMLIQ